MKVCGRGTVLTICITASARHSQVDIFPNPRVEVYSVERQNQKDSYLGVPGTAEGGGTILKTEITQLTVKEQY